MQITTQAIVLNSIKYGDSSLIVKCFTKEAGMKSYMLRGVRKSKKGKLKPAYFQPLNQLELTASHNNKGNLNTLKDTRITYPYETLYQNYTKQAVAYFLAEVLNNCLQEDEQNTALFLFLETSLKWLDLHQNSENFHLVFLTNLSRYLGIYPETSGLEKSYFGLKEGKFLDSSPYTDFVLGRELILFKGLLGTNFDNIEKVLLNVNDRQKLLEILMKYFELHLSGFRRPRSIQVLKELFSQ
jgi:DNA repair protein RecO (recombination protein O)